MGALEEASQWHVQGFGIKVSSFPSPGASPTATRTTVNMLLTVLAITRWVTLDSCQAGRECPWPRPSGTSEAWLAGVSDGGRSQASSVPTHVSRTLLGQGWKWGTLHEDSRRWCILGNHHHLWFTTPQGTRSSTERKAPDVGCPHIIANSFSFPLHTCNLVVSLLLSLSNLFSFFLLLTWCSSVLHSSLSHMLS